MKKLHLGISVLLLSLLAPITGVGQTSSGTEFWIAYMENLTLFANDQPVFSIYISSEVTTDGSISVPATGFAIPFSVNAGEVIEVNLPSAIWYSETSEVVEGKGVRVTSTAPIQVSTTHFRLFFTEATGVLPLTSLSDEYIVTCFYEGVGSQFPASFVIVGTQDKTEISITPTTFTNGLRPADIPFTITLNAGEIYQVQANGDLSGSIIRAVNGEKIAVFSGAQQAVVGNCRTPSNDNQLYEQALPIDDWATLYYFVPFANQGGDLVKIIAQTDDTQVFFDCTLETNLNAGEAYTTKVSNPTVITATHPISVTQINESQSCNPSGLGDPNMLTHRPTSYQTRRAAWRATPTTSGSAAFLSKHFSNIIMKTVDIVDLTLDGTPVDAANFLPFPADPTMSYLQLETTSGNHLLTAANPFHIYHYGFGDFDAYTFTGTFQANNDLVYNCLEIDVEGTLCVDSTLTFAITTTAVITDYDWQLNDGQRANSSQPTFSFSQAGRYQLTLTLVTEQGALLTEQYDFEIFDCSDEVCENIPTVDLSISDNCSGVSITFSLATDANFLAVEWLFGDGRRSDQLNPALS